VYLSFSFFLLRGPQLRSVRFGGAHVGNIVVDKDADAMGTPVTAEGHELRV
jgi:hypothetical protein